MSATTKLDFENISVTLENSQFLFPTSPWLAKHLLLSVFTVFYKCFFHVFINGIKVYSFLHLSFFNLMPLRFLHVVVLFILPGCIFNCVDIPYFLFQTGSQGYPQVCYITEAGPELLVLLSLSPKWWNYKHAIMPFSLATWWALWRVETLVCLGLFWTPCWLLLLFPQEMRGSVALSSWPWQY